MKYLIKAMLIGMAVWAAFLVGPANAEMATIYQAVPGIAYNVGEVVQLSTSAYWFSLESLKEIILSFNVFGPQYAESLYHEFLKDNTIVEIVNQGIAQWKVIGHENGWTLYELVR